MPGRTPIQIDGEFSATFTKDGVPFGILGLNSAFLQLTGDHYERKLGLGLKQFHAACNGDGPAWAKQHCACLLMTRHPREWLEPNSQDALIREIMGGNRFALHLCGHMHETRTRGSRTGGGIPRRLIQARALFGLEWFGDAKLERMHGCVAARLRIDGDPPAGHWQSWPRKYHLAGDDRAIIPDPDLRLDDSGRYTPPEPFDPAPGCSRPQAGPSPQPDSTGTADPDPSAPTLARAPARSPGPPASRRLPTRSPNGSATSEFSEFSSEFRDRPRFLGYAARTTRGRTRPAD